MLSIMRTWLLVAVALAACGESKSTTAEQPKRTPRALPPDASVAQLEANRTLCSATFTPETIGGIVGGEFVGNRPGRVTAGTSACQQLYRVEEASVEVSLALDCRSLHPRIASITRTFEKKKGFRTIDIGVGGVAAVEGALHRLSFESENPSCAVYVTTKGAPTDVTESLARHVMTTLPKLELPR